MTRTLTIFCLLLLLAGCNLFSEELLPFSPELEESSLTTDPELVRGTWEHRRTNEYLSSSGRSITTLTEQDANWMEIDADSVHRFKADSLAWSSAYTLERLGEMPGRMNLKDRNTHFLYGVNSTKLVLSTAHVNGSEEVFERAD